MPDHIHCLFLLNPTVSVSNTIKQVKGSSSFYINQNNMTVEPFAWQAGYAACSVSASVVNKIFYYFRNQKTHHQKKTFQREFEEFMQRYGLQDEDRMVW